MTDACPPLDLGVFRWQIICYLIGIDPAQRIGELDYHQARKVLQTTFTQANRKASVHNLLASLDSFTPPGLNGVTEQFIRNSLFQIIHVLHFASMNKIGVYWG